MLEFLLPSFRVLTGLLLPLTFALVGLTRRDRDAATGVRHTDGQPAEAARAGNGNGNGSHNAQEDTDAEAEAHGDERRMLQSIVDFGEILVREVMTPRPDIVAIQDDRDDRRRCGRCSASRSIRASRCSTRTSTTSPASCS